MPTDPVYEGKSMAALIDLVRGGRIELGSNVSTDLGGQPAPFRDVSRSSPFSAAPLDVGSSWPCRPLPGELASRRSGARPT